VVLLASLPLRDTCQRPRSCRTESSTVGHVLGLSPRLLQGRRLRGEHFNDLVQVSLRGWRARSHPSPRRRASCRSGNRPSTNTAPMHVSAGSAVHVDLAAPLAQQPRHEQDQLERTSQVTRWDSTRSLWAGRHLVRPLVPVGSALVRGPSACPHVCPDNRLRSYPSLSRAVRRSMLQLVIVP
jgi:hypothetical protein